MKAQQQIVQEQYRIGDLNCKSAEYKFKVSLEKFRFSEFKRAFFRRSGKDDVEEGVLFTSVLSTKDKESSDFHVHLSWFVSRAVLKLNVEFYAEPRKPDPGEKEPFAEEVMPWVGEYFKSEQATAHVHFALDYPKSRWRSVFPLPISIPVEGNPEIEIDGMSFGLKKAPAGIKQAWLLDREKKIRVILHGDRPIRFKEFHLRHELESISPCTSMLVREVSQ